MTIRLDDDGTTDTANYQAGEHDIEIAPLSAQEEAPFTTYDTNENPNIMVDITTNIAETNHTIDTFPESSPDDDDDDDAENPNDDEQTRHWKASPYAVGLVSIDWKVKPEGRIWFPLTFSYMFCKRAGRLGNMVVLYERETKRTTAAGESNADITSSSIPKPIIMMGPHWPMMVCITYPLIIGVSLATFVLEIRNAHIALVATWTVMTILLLLSLARVACRNPGVFPRHAESPVDDGTWIWNDQGRTFRPLKAKYDSECAVVVEEYDHTCPWTGTAIGKHNMRAFQCFVAMVGIMLLFDISLLAAPI